MRRLSPRPFLSPRLLTFLVTAALFFCLLYYGAYAYFGYPSAPGGDLYNHVGHVQELQQQGIKVFWSGYPKLFHLIVLIGMKVTGLPALKVMLYLVPLVLLASALAVGWVALLVAGEVAAAVTVFILLFVSYQPSQTLYDGGFPNTIAAHIWLPLLIGSLYLALTTRRRSWWLLSLLWLAFLISTHGFTFIYTLVILLCLPLYYFSRCWRWLPALVLLAVGLLLSPLGQAARLMLSTVLTFQAQFPWVHLVGHLDNPNAIWPLRVYPPAISYLSVYLGMVGIAVLVWQVVRRKQSSLLAFLLLAWLTILFVGSRTEALGFPVRLARDLGSPLAASAGVGFAFFWERFRGRLARLALVALCLYLGFSQIQVRFMRILTYEPTMLYSQADQEAGAAIGNEPAVALNELLPSAAQPNIRPLLIDPDQPVAEDALWPLKTAQVVVYPSPRQGDVPGYHRLLISRGFHEDAQFTDPLKTVWLFRR